MGKYDPLRDYLRICGNDEIILSFADIETIIGGPLPPSANKYDQWWVNSPSIQHIQAESWHSAGYKVHVNRTARTARFCRESISTIAGISRNGSSRINPVDINTSMTFTGAYEIVR